MAKLILASSSPRRRALLQQLALPFEVYSPNIDESVIELEQAQQYVYRLAIAKAEAVLHHFPDCTVIAADTTIAVEGEIIGKPASKAHAFDIWHRLSGRCHDVLTGVCVANRAQLHCEVVTTCVEFQTLSLQDMERYWATGEPQGKAGAYAIQGIAAQFIPKIQGSYSNVVGLPLHETALILKAFKVLN
ncbi:MAG: Maf family nucleotide pyrophosphatase [Acinetobacter sp.]